MRRTERQTVPYPRVWPDAIEPWLERERETVERERAWRKLLAILRDVVMRSPRQRVAEGREPAAHPHA